MKNIVMMHTALRPCPACSQPLILETQVEITKTGELVDGSVPFEGKPIGARIKHDCIPAVTR